MGKHIVIKKIHMAQPHVILSVLRVSGKQEGLLTHSVRYLDPPHTGELPLPGIRNINEFFSTSRSAPAFMMIGFLLVDGLDLFCVETRVMVVPFIFFPLHPVHF